MENASKALIMAAGILFGMLIISLLVYAYNEYVDYGTAKQEAANVESVVEFNKQYETYNRDGLRGNEVLSLVNKILDYNENQADRFGYPEIESMVVDISINTASDLFAYGSAYAWIPKNKKSIELDEFEDMLNNINDMEKKLTSTQLSKLAANIYTIQDAEDRDETIAQLLGISSTDIDYDDIDYDDIEMYYEYTQFKRGIFNCTGITTEPVSGRVNSFEFKFTGKLN